ncbi:hypothetical protein HO173_001238 [Letharia columbiana]|uniref:Aminotransferase class I/classII large domain-containing protein n=1 Tax=Letharia columbiana TaxID=112416 RepID=A0A8H6G4T8_9LECA|nr:uncharacterized protein HO173_001238 [Letharia columbiana]KAF6240568.1 hypothetical protein HO173_001238 [Letharia columbiana]
MDCLSRRGHSNVTKTMAQLPKAMLENIDNDTDVREYHEPIDLSMAENWLIREEVLGIGKLAIEKHFDGHHLSMPTDFWGNPRLLKLLANLFNNYFAPKIPVQQAHIAVSSGAATCLDTLLWNICNEGDGVLIPGPYWNGYDVHCRNRSATSPILVSFPRLQDAFSMALVTALEKTFASSSCTIKALILTNPHNPLGQCYPKPVLEECLRFCQRRNIHLISDEVFALSTFNPSQVDLPETRHFVSMLAVDPTALDCDPGRVHVVWSMSKDFAAGGIKLVRAAASITKTDIYNS